MPKKRSTQLDREIAEALSRGKRFYATPKTSHSTVKSSEPIYTLSADQLKALHTFAKANGRSWKSKLNHAWSTGRYDDYNGTDDYGSLQQIRNRFGPVWLSRFSFDRAKTHGGRSHSTVRRDEELVPTAEARRGVQTIRRREEFPEILAILMRVDGTNYQIKVPDPKNKRGYDLVDVLIHHNGARSIKSASRSRTTPERASRIVTKYLEATR